MDESNPWTSLLGGAENAGHENAGPEIDGPMCRA